MSFLFIMVLFPLGLASPVSAKDDPPVFIKKPTSGTPVKPLEGDTTTHTLEPPISQSHLIYLFSKYLTTPYTSD